MRVWKDGKLWELVGFEFITRKGQRMFTDRCVLHLLGTGPCQ
jgi:hypothetical protein